MAAVTTVTAVTAQIGTELILSQYGGKYKKPQVVKRTDSGQDASSRASRLGCRQKREKIRAGKTDIDIARMMSKKFKGE
jgi:hypothetical protein